MSLPRVLVVDDTPANLLAIETLLSECMVDVVTASSGQEALKLSLQGDFALVLLDVEMPGMDGYETASLLRMSARTKEVPIIFVTASQSEKQHVFRGYETGAVDYMLKPLNPMILVSKVKVFAELFALKESEKRGAVQEEQAKEHRRLNSILDHMLVGVIMAEAPTGKISFLNRHLPWMKVFDEEQIHTKNGERIPVERQAVARALAGETIDEEEVVCHLKDGTRRSFLISAMPIRDDQGEITSAVVSFLDITARVAAEAAREEARNQLQHAYKMSALGEMAGGIAHEVNNPLAIIIGKSRLLREELATWPPDKATVEKFVVQIEETAQRIVKIVNGLRTISRSSDRDPCIRTAVQTLVDGTLAICNVKFKYQSIDLNVTLDPGLAIECRAAEISQVLLNLISNSLDAIENLPEKWVKITAKACGDFVEIAVEDSGQGVPPELRDRIMQPFFTTKDVGKGTGLGLSISKSIVETHGGKFTLDERSPHTRFVVTLPVRQVVPQTPTKAAG